MSDRTRFWLTFVTISVGAAFLVVEYGWMTGVGVWLIAAACAPGNDEVCRFRHD